MILFATKDLGDCNSHVVWFGVGRGRHGGVVDRRRVVSRYLGLCGGVHRQSEEVKKVVDGIIPFVCLSQLFTYVWLVARRARVG